jgi:hypothetical protein
MPHFNFKHGLSYTKIRNVWNAMHQRCTNPNTKSYAIYGARGIAVCERWKSVQAFVADMGIPEKGMTLERINNDLGYSPDNCKWVTRTAQAHNRRSSRHVVLDGKPTVFCVAARALGYEPSSIHQWMTKHNLTHQAAIDHYATKRRVANG